MSTTKDRRGTKDSEREGADVLPVIGRSGEDFPGLGGDDAAVNVEASDLEDKRKEQVFRLSHTRLRSTLNVLM